MHHRALKSLVIALIGLMTGMPVQAEAYRFALEPIHGLGISTEELTTLSESLQTQLAGYPGSAVVDATKLPTTSPLKCRQSTACHSKLQDLGVTHIVVPTVGGLGSVFSVTLRAYEMISSAEQAMARTTGKRAQQTFVESLRDATSQLADALGMNDPGFYIVSGLPEETTITINQFQIIRTTAELETILQLPPGRHTLLYSRDGFKNRSEEIFVTPRQRHSENVELAQSSTTAGYVSSPLFAANTTVTHEHQKPARKKFVGSPIFWSIIGAVVAGGTTAAILSLTGGTSSDNNPNLNPNVTITAPVSVGRQ